MENRGARWRGGGEWVAWERRGLQVTGTTASLDGLRGANDPSPSPKFSSPPPNRAPHSHSTPRQAVEGRCGCSHP